jgi:ubiquinone/menaquinone biosynthesis C-methylase UbiE
MTDSEVTSKAADNLPARDITSGHFAPSTGTRGIDVADAFGRLAPPGAASRPTRTGQRTDRPGNPDARGSSGEASSTTVEDRGSTVEDRGSTMEVGGSTERARGSTGLAKVTSAVVAAARVQPGDRVIDLGCGSGVVSLELAERGAHVLAVDADPVLLNLLLQAAQARSPLPGLEILTRPLDRLSLPVRSADLIVTTYALHRLRDADKQRLIAAAYHWLRPGGTLIVADMMFGRGTTSQDRAIIRSKVRSLARKGVGGWWRIAKNSYRYLIRVKEHPISISAWTAIFAKAGFTGITASRIVNEAGLVLGRRPIDEPTLDPLSAKGRTGSGA